ncbi:molybdopterin-dependent oxidoreductase [Mycolicibacterium vaccae]|uniref:Molybdopterin dinucleotide-binding region n=1 Tax=Mycolicibacterium vaccae ATCC 25954 TaxID=1194972 RepID=K0V0C1_MYCVA|nr:molybdopterin-dependent oxidoreductase [Mycolicibacterium vaccae]ANI38938.1 molybdopterin dinucleotide-binding protein [Mycolicibacterium vaccae 95051]EJZ12431.1 molybdopterin dinucleotide-binding region [Mycolicibacterium vaccae ATCC 25954]MCV7064153.1 molybdopterin-dependent oxidoreductase [Mycolicibacterium vaccae]
MEHRITCPLCEAMCGLRVTVDHGTATSVRGDPDDVWSRGHLCPKGASLHHIHHDPDRLRTPLVRTRTGDHVPVTWDDAFAEAEKVLRPVVDSFGAAAVTVYLGNPVAHNLGLETYVGALVGLAGAAGMPAYYTPGTVDQWPLNVVSALLFGGMWNAPIPDLDRTDHLVMVGANPAASQGSMLSAPDIMGRLAAIRGRGGRVVVIDPRRTATARRASEWVPVRPGTDALLLFAVLRTLAEHGAIRRPAHLDGLVDGLDDVVALAEPFAPEDVEAATGVPATTIRRLAADLAAAQRPVLYSRIGACTQEFGTLATWLVFVLNVALGSIDRPGGALFPKAAVWSPMFMKPPDQPGPGWRFGRFRSRVRGTPEVLGQFPVSCLAEEIDTPGDGRIRGLITVAGNPVLSAPGAGRLDAALAGLDAMISVDNWLNETSRHAHVVLPGLSPLERPHCDDLYWMYSIASCVKWSEPALAPPPDRPQEWELMLRLAGALLGTPLPEVDVPAMDDLYTQGIIHTACQAADTPMFGRDPAEVFAALEGVGPERMIDLGIRVGPWGDDVGRRPGGLTLAEVRRHPDGLRLGELDGGRLADVLTTPSGRIELVHPVLTADVARLADRSERAAPDLVLTSRRHLRSNNSWLHNVSGLMRGRERCTLLIHPDDAAGNGVSDGQLVEVSTSEGSVVVVAEVSDEMMPGVVSLPHGWGHGVDGTRMDVANSHPGVNVNRLNPGALVDVPSNTQVVNGVPCRVRTRRGRPPGSGR